MSETLYPGLDDTLRSWKGIERLAVELSVKPKGLCEFLADSVSECEIHLLAQYSARHRFPDVRPACNTQSSEGSDAGTKDRVVLERAIKGANVGGGAQRAFNDLSSPRAGGI